MHHEDAWCSCSCPSCSALANESRQTSEGLGVDLGSWVLLQKKIERICDRCVVQRPISHPPGEGVFLGLVRPALGRSGLWVRRSEECSNATRQNLGAACEVSEVGFKKFEAVEAALRFAIRESVRPLREIGTYDPFGHACPNIRQMKVKNSHGSLSRFAIIIIAHYYLVVSDRGESTKPPHLILSCGSLSLVLPKYISLPHQGCVFHAHDRIALQTTSHLCAYGHPPCDSTAPASHQSHAAFMCHDSCSPAMSPQRHLNALRAKVGSTKLARWMSLL